MLRRPGHVSNCAISLAWLLDFTKKNRVRERGLSTAQVVFELVVPATAAAKCRFTDLLLQDPAPEQRGAVSGGRPFYFISHAWGRPFCETLDMLARHFSSGEQFRWRRDAGSQLPPLGNEETFVWFDMFAINQQADSGQQADDLAALKEVVADAEETVMVLDPQGSPLTRIWCLFEAWQAGRAADMAAAAAAAAAKSAGAEGGNPDAGLTPAVASRAAVKALRTGLWTVETPGYRGLSSGGHQLRLLTYEIPFEQLKQLFIELDVERAQATKDEDRTRILADINADQGGLLGMTHRLKDALVAGLLAQVPADLNWTPDTSARLNTAAELCLLYGKLDEAERLCRRDYFGAKITLPPDEFSKLLLEPARTLAWVLYAKGEYDAAEQYFRETVEGCQKLLGPDDPRVAMQGQNIGLVLWAQGKHVEAEPFYRRALEAAKQQLGAAHADTLSALGGLAGLLAEQRKYGEAEMLYRRALEGTEQALGPENPYTLILVHNLARMLASSGRGMEGQEEAEELFRRALVARERVLGPSHQETMETFLGLAKVLEDEGKLDAAEALCRRKLQHAEQAVGPQGRDTLLALRQLGRVLTARGEFEDAEEALWCALMGLEKRLGACDPETTATAMSLLDVLIRQQQYDVAEMVSRQAVANLQKEVPEDNPTAADPKTAKKLLDFLEVLAAMLEGQAKHREAEEVFRRAVALGDKVEGGDDEGALARLGMLAEALEAQGKAGEAQEIYRRALERSERVSGLDHPETIDLAHKLAELLVKGAEGPTELAATDGQTGAGSENGWEKQQKQWLQEEQEQEEEEEEQEQKREQVKQLQHGRKQAWAQAQDQGMVEGAASKGGGGSASKEEGSTAGFRAVLLGCLAPLLACAHPGKVHKGVH